MLANASTPLIGFVDAVVIGRLGDAALIGGIAVEAAIFNAILLVRRLRHRQLF